MPHEAELKRSIHGMIVSASSWAMRPSVEMRYIGSKIASLSAIARAIAASGICARSLCDPFAGTCTVARYFKSLGLRVVTGDVLLLSYVQQISYIETNRRPSFIKALAQCGNIGSTATASETVLAYLMGLEPTSSFLSAEYSPLGRSQRKFLTADNAGRADAIRNQIAAWTEMGVLSAREFSYLLSALLEAIDRVANTAGTYYAYLKSFNRKSLQAIRLLPPAIVNNGQRNQAHLSDALDLVGRADTDVLYLDPPYNGRNYGGYYHLPESVVRWDRLAVRGKSGVPVCKLSDSPYYHRSTAADALRELVRVSRARCILLHYATDGFITHHQILRILRSRGRTAVTNWSVRKYNSRKAAGAVAQCGHRLYTCLT